MKRHSVLNTLCIFCLFFVVSIAAASQIYNVSDGDTIHAKISNLNINRILIENGKIEKVWNISDQIESKPDKKSGTLYFKPRPGPRASFSFFIQDDSGFVYTVALDSEPISAQTIVVKPKVKRQKVSHRQKNEPYISKIKKLIAAMARNSEIDGYAVESVSKKIPLWKEVEITLIKTYINQEFIGNVYQIRNVSEETMVLQESEFSNFGNTSAIALSNLSLKPGSKTNLFVVRR